jgi:hypothetical protein
MTDEDLRQLVHLLIHWKADRRCWRDADVARVMAEVLDAIYGDDRG